MGPKNVSLHFNQLACVIASLAKGGMVVNINGPSGPFSFIQGPILTYVGSVFKRFLAKSCIQVDDLKFLRNPWVMTTTSLILLLCNILLIQCRVMLLGRYAGFKRHWPIWPYRANLEFKYYCVFSGGQSIHYSICSGAHGVLYRTPCVCRGAGVLTLV